VTVSGADCKSMPSSFLTNVGGSSKGGALASVSAAPQMHQKYSRQATKNPKRRGLTKKSWHILRLAFLAAFEGHFPQKCPENCLPVPGPRVNTGGVAKISLQKVVDERQLFLSTTSQVAFGTAPGPERLDNRDNTTPKMEIVASKQYGANMQVYAPYKTKSMPPRHLSSVCFPPG
jgi:hypothetical protein